MWSLKLPLVLALSCTAATVPKARMLQNWQETQASASAAAGFRDAERSAQLAEQAWQYVPSYTGEHRWSLSAAQRAQTLAGLHILTAATVLDPNNQLAWWRRGHAATLLGNDDRARNAPGAEQYAAMAQNSLSRARALSPEDPWSAYALAIAQADLGAWSQSVDHLQLAIELCAPGIATEGPDSTSAWIAFKSREWLNEILMRSGRFGEARTAIESFYADYGENAWPLRIALGECALRQREFAAAREHYAWIVEQPEFAGDPQAHAMLGYLEGLLGHTERASAHLADAVARERVPQLYARLWQWILAPNAHPELRVALEKFLNFPPPQLSAWDLRLGRFLLGDGPPDSLIHDARVELQRRWEANEEPGDLLCEAHFYTGLRYELDAAAREDPTVQAEMRSTARAHYGEALSARPFVWKWEWAYARLRDAGLNRTLGVQRRPQPFASLESSDLARYALHPLGAEAPLSWEEARKQRGFFQPGDLLLSYTLVPREEHPTVPSDTIASYSLKLFR